VVVDARLPHMLDVIYCAITRRPPMYIQRAIVVAVKTHMYVGSMLTALPVCGLLGAVDICCAPVPSATDNANPPAVPPDIYGAATNAVQSLWTGNERMRIVNRRRTKLPRDAGTWTPGPTATYIPHLPCLAAASSMPPLLLTLPPAPKFRTPGSTDPKACGASLCLPTARAYEPACRRCLVPATRGNTGVRWLSPPAFSPARYRACRRACCCSPSVVTLNASHLFGLTVSPPLMGSYLLLFFWAEHSFR